MKVPVIICDDNLNMTVKLEKNAVNISGIAK